MYRQSIWRIQLTFVLILYMRLLLEAHAAIDVCSICNCKKSKTYIYCSNRGLTSIPHPLPPNVEYLNLYNNDIEKVEEGIFGNLPSLRELYLYHNDIEEIEVESFRNLRSLEILDLQSNKLTEIEAETFQDLPSLKKLHLNYNNIKEIEVGSFKNLSSLATLYLNDNDIKEIKAGSFQNLTSLKYLYLYENDIEEIKAETIRNLRSLEVLDLESNNIAKIEAGTFGNLPNLETVYLNYNDIDEIEVGSFTNISSLKSLYLQSNSIKKIDAGTFEKLPDLATLDLQSNDIIKIDAGTFENLPRLTTLDLQSNNIMKIEAGTFANLPSVTKLHLRNNQIKSYEDGAFLFLPSLTFIDLRNNSQLVCQCHLPVLVKYINSTYSRTVDVKGECHNKQSKVIPILEYSQCKDYSLFQQHLQCQTCSGMICKDSEVTNCTEAEPVCRSKLSIDGDTLKFEKSCSTYRTCLDAMRNDTFTCNKWTSGTSCVACCTGNLCNKNGSLRWTNSFVAHLIYYSTFKKVNENSKPTETISKAMEHELSNYLTGVFKVEYCGSEEYKKIFTINCTVPDAITKDQVLKNIFETFTTSQILRNLGFEQRNMELIDERVCKENTTSTIDGTFYWPITKIGTNVTIPCHANVATRYCSFRTAVHLGIPTSQHTTSPKCSPFTGIWRDPDMSPCYNTDGITRQLKTIIREDINKGNVNEISKKLVDVSQKSLYFKEEDIALAVDIQEKMVPLISNVADNITTNNMILSINNMINTPEKILVEAEQSTRTVTRMLDIIETIAEKIPLEEQQFTVLYSNLGIGVIKVEDTFNGALYGVSYGNNGIDSSTTIQDNPYADRQKATNLLSIPTSILRHLKDEDLSNISRIGFTSMQDDKMYRAIQKSNTETNTQIISPIIAANIPNIRITDLDEPVTISFTLTDQNAINPLCVYWEESPGQNPHWSTKGCNITKYVPGEKVSCSCNHLTSFAILMNKGNTQSIELSYIIGCGIAFVLLVLT